MEKWKTFPANIQAEDPLFILKIRDLSPALLKIVCRHLRPPVSGKETFFISVGAHAALDRGEIRKIPDLLADEEVWFYERLRQI